MRKEMDNWDFSGEGESVHEMLTRFLIGIDELRARLTPGVYPNLEISDEGYLWFNVPSSVGKVEVFALPFGLGPLPGPALALSVPHNPKDREMDFTEVFHRIATGLDDACLFAAYATLEKTLGAYLENRLPELYFLKGKVEILNMREKVDFYCYFGLWFSAKNLTVLSAEKTIREILSRLESSVL
ncbi:MAG: hypothetical protein WBA22_08425 [Candidatus Methanofastidiosia archaeon]